MFLLAHTGIALGAAVVANGASADRAPGRRAAPEKADPDEMAAGAAVRPHFAGRWAASLGRRIDLRVLLVGALLPDLVDKPLGRLFYGTFGCRLSCHSLLFLAIVAAAGLGLFLLRRRGWLLVLAFGVLTHLVLDGMWADPSTLFWPLTGTTFEAVAQGNWEWAMLRRLYQAPGVYLPELLGAAVLAWFAWLLVRRHRVRSFLRDGRV